MLRTQRLACVLVVVVTMCVVSGVHREVSAQQPVNTSPLMVGVAGTADAGTSFVGTFLLTRFDALATNSLVAVGSVDGVLNGRSIVTKVTVPVTVLPGSALQTADVPASCNTVHVSLEPAAFRALGSVVTLAGSGLDITAPQGSVNAPTSSATPAASSLAGLPITAPATSGMTPTTSGVGTAAAFPTEDTTATTDAFGTPVPTAPAGSATPGVISPPPRPVAPAPQQLGQLLCSVSGLSQSSASPAQLANALNQVMLALHQ